MAFKALGDPDRAIQSLNTAVSQAPGFREAHQELALLYEAMNRPDLRSRHDRAARGMT
jgi:Tfp pilus assembly protein PilF